VTPQEALDWLDGAQVTGIKLGLENTHRLLAALDHPERRTRFLHVAGTNGKGSVCAMLEAVLRRAGFRTGLYTSPHLVDFRERIRVGEKMIPPAALADGLSRLREAVRDWDHGPTFFELATALALDHFAREGCDIVVLETGMGGRLDSTNAVTPLVSTITPIDLDHREWLGDTIAQIAFEKAGIIKPGVPVVSSPQTPEAAEVLRRRAAESSAPIEFIDQPWPGPVGLAGDHQKWNAAVASATLRASGLAIPEAALREGLATVEWPARFQRLGARFVIDGAHNAHSAKALVATWREAFGNARATILFGALRDKDHAEMLDLLSPIAARFFFVPVDSDRSESPAAFATPAGADAHRVPSLREALERARDFPESILITGSLFLAGEALRIFDENPSLKACDARPAG
jgi:dihydrofolate synthase / folylpolyglutamate synthase